MAMGVEFSPEERKTKMAALIAAIMEDEAMFMDDACRLVGLKYQTAYDWKRQDEEFSAAWDAALAEARERRVNEAERRLHQNVLKNDNTAIIFFLKTIGRLRGFQEKVDVNHTHTIEALGIEEAARRIAFAMNGAIEKGVVIDGDYKEVVHVSNRCSDNEIVKVEKSVRVAHAKKARASAKAKSKAVRSTQ